MEKKEIDVVEEENKLVVTLSKPYVFEGVTYTEMDLTPLDNIRAADMIKVNRTLTRSGSTDFLQEMTLEYACVLAAQVTKMPVEFYEGLPAKDAMKLKSRVTGFLYGTE